MTRCVYVNGRYLPHADAGVHVEDRGFLFADAVYEVFEVHSGGIVDEARHLARLSRSLSELDIQSPMSEPALRHVLRETLRRNRVRDGLIYLQVTRGKAQRDFPFPPAGTEATVVCFARRLDKAKVDARAANGIKIVSAPDIRWGRCDLKTVMLLPACLAKEAARRSGAFEAWFVDGAGFVTEGASSNAWIVLRDGTVVTRHTDERILGGVTRLTVLDVLATERLTVGERAFTLEEAKTAAEAFITSATGTVMPVVNIDGVTVGEGRPGPVTQRLRAAFHAHAHVSSALQFIT